MTTVPAQGDMPPLPEPFQTLTVHENITEPRTYTIDLFTSKQVREAQRLAIELSRRQEAPPLTVPNSGVFLIVFDDADRKPEMYTSEAAARHRYEAISVSWNAHLFVKINSNSRDDRHAKNNAALAAGRQEASEPVAPDACICKGNWRAIVKETERLIGRKYRGHDGEIYRFFGIVHGEDDYYYGMQRDGQMWLLSCVGSIEGHGYASMPESPKAGE